MVESLPMDSSSLLARIALAAELLFITSTTSSTSPAGDHVHDPSFMPYYKSTVEMGEDKGFNVTRHEVRTEDGYWLTLHRLPNPSGTPVLLVHGLLASSDQWLLLSREESYALLLADAGYDVWMANLRGNVYSRRHDTLSPDTDPQFWEFSLHEIGYYDLPAMVDHVCSATGHRRVFYSGYSVGGTLFLIMTASRPEYSAKILGAILLAPLIVRPDSPGLTTSPLFKITFEFIFAFVRLLKQYQVGEFYPRQQDMLRVKQDACRPSAHTFPLCVSMLQKPFGLMPSQYDVTKLEYFLKSFGSGTSTKVVEHVMQIVQSGHLRQFSYNPIINLIRYGSYKPPDYNISNTRCPVVLHYDKNDYLIDYKAVQSAARQLPCVLCDCMGDQEGFSHFGYVISNQARRYVFRQVIRSLRTLEAEAEADSIRCS